MAQCRNKETPRAKGTHLAVRVYDAGAKGLDANPRQVVEQSRHEKEGGGGAAPRHDPPLYLLEDAELHALRAKQSCQHTTPTRASWHDAADLQLFAP